MAEWPALASRMRWELRRFNLREQERLVVDALLDVSIALARPVVRLNRWTSLADLLGIDRSDLRRAAEGLTRAAIVKIERSEEALECRLLPDPGTWQERARTGRADLWRGLGALLQFNGLEQSELWPSPGLGAAIQSVSIETASADWADCVQPGDNQAREIPSRGNFPPPLPHTPSPEGIKSFTAMKLLSEGGRGETEATEGNSPLGGQAEIEAMDRCHEVLGAHTMQDWGGLWRKRSRTNPGKVARVLAAVESDAREGKEIRNRGGYANDLWKRFAD